MSLASKERAYSQTKGLDRGVLCFRASCVWDSDATGTSRLKKTFLRKETRPFSSLPLELLGTLQELERELEGELNARATLRPREGGGKVKIAWWWLLSRISTNRNE